MSTIKYLSIALIAYLTVACSQQPMLLLESQEPQRKILVAKHWRGLADRVVTNLLCRSPQQTCGPAQSAKQVSDAVHSGQSLYVADSARDMPFSSMFKTYLKQSLLDHGFKVSTSPQNAAVLRFRGQTLLYDHRSGKHFPLDKASFWTTLGALGLAVADGTRKQGIATLLIAGPVIDFLISLYDVTNAEVVITAFVEDEHTIPFMYTEEFYIEPTDLHLYYTNNSLLIDHPPRPRVIHTAKR